MVAGAVSHRMLAASGKHGTDLSALHALDRGFAIPTHADQLGQAPSVVPIGLVDPHRQGGLGMMGVETGGRGSPATFSSCHSQDDSDPVSRAIRSACRRDHVELIRDGIQTPSALPRAITTRATAECFHISEMTLAPRTLASSQLSPERRTKPQATQT